MKQLLLLACLLALSALAFGQWGSGCNKQNPEFQSSFICVCNSTHCDFPRPITEPIVGLNYTRIVSSRDEHRFEEFNGLEESTITGSTVIVVEHFLPEEQEILGFGGSFTDSAGINIMSLSSGARDILMRSYFAREGIQYNMARSPIAGSDFSTYAYSYDDVWNDVDLTFFSLTEEDYNYKIPLIKMAMNMSENNLKLMGSVWSPPAWMKTNGMHNESGILNRTMWQPFSDYMIRYLQDYNAEGIEIWGVTPQNEPLTGFTNHPWNTCGWTKEDMRDWIRDYFGPDMVANGYQDVAIMVYDHNRDYIPDYPATTLNDSEANQYVSGTAVHWYNDHPSGTGPEVLDELHNMHPDKFILYTESCAGWADADRVKLGDWERAERYASNIIEDLNHHSVGWIDWNLALDMQGGPNWVSNFVDSPIIINAAADEFYKQPMFYAMGHFSKYLKRGGHRIPTVVTGSATSTIFAVAVHNPNGEEAVVVLNTGETDEAITIEAHSGQFINYIINRKSIETVLYQADE